MSINPSAACPARRVAGGGYSNRSRADFGTDLDTAEETFAALTAGDNPPLAIDGRKIGYGLPTRMIDLSELKSILLHPSTSYAARDAVWRHVVTLVRTVVGPWRIGAVGLAAPRLQVMSKTLVAEYGVERADVDGELLTGFLAALSTVDIDAPRVVTRLCSAAFVAARQVIRSQQPGRAGVVTGFAAAAPQPPFGHPDLVLTRAVRAEVITAEEAELIGSTRLEDVRLADYTKRNGRSYSAVVSQRHRAEKRLADAITSGALGSDWDVILAETTTTLFDAGEDANG